MKAISCSLLFAMSIGCGASVDDPCRDIATRGSCESGSNQDEDAAARAFRDHALPVFEVNCIACHGGADGFLAGDTPEEIRATLLASGVIDLIEQLNSPAFTKGVHAGPSLSATQAAEILKWIDAEKAR